MTTNENEFEEDQNYYFWLGEGSTEVEEVSEEEFFFMTEQYRKEREAFLNATD